MLFNSAEYALFLPIVLALYFLAGRISLRTQNGLLLVASYFFYGWWDWRFLGLLALSSLIDYSVGIGMGTPDERRRKLLFYASLAANLGILGFFKYYNFFADSLIAAFDSIGITLHARSLNVILPVGVSFYTFQSLTYTIGVYRRQVQPTRDWITFFSYVAFFPQLVAGPIERAGHLLPQFLRQRVITLDNFVSGLRQITWGLFCKIVVADNCAVIVNSIFALETPPAGSMVLLGGFFFAWQIYGDFSGYTHIALGSARLLGFELMQNFATPYFSQSIPEFWRRWHISLSSWFRDYVYIPLGGNRGGRLRQSYTLLTTFLVSGLWHGANWTFVAWGFLNGLYCLPRLFIGEPLARLAQSRNWLLRWGTILFRMGLTFFLTMIAWIIFRSETLARAGAYLGNLFSATISSSPVDGLRELGMLKAVFVACFAIAIMAALEWVQRDKRFALEVEAAPAIARWSAYACIIVLTLTLRHTGAALDFIYFQF